MLIVGGDKDLNRNTGPVFADLISLKSFPLFSDLIYKKLKVKNKLIKQLNINKRKQINKYKQVNKLDRNNK